MIRSSVVLPEPDGPSSASSSPSSTLRSTSSSAAKLPNFLTRFLTSMVIGRRVLRRRVTFENGLGDQRDQRQHRQQRGDREGGDELVLVVENLDHAAAWCWSRRGCGRRRPRPRRTRPSRARCRAGRRRAAPHLMLGSVTRKKVCQPEAPSEIAASSSSRALLLHQRDQLARDEREGHEDGGEHDAGHREHDLDVVIAQPAAEPALRAEQQHEDEARDHRATPRTAGRSA